MQHIIHQPKKIRLREEETDLEARQPARLCWFRFVPFKCITRRYIWRQLLLATGNLSKCRIFLVSICSFCPIHRGYDVHLSQCLNEVSSLKIETSDIFFETHAIWRATFLPPFMATNWNKLVFVRNPNAWPEKTSVKLWWISLKFSHACKLEMFAVPSWGAKLIKNGHQR